MTAGQAAAERLKTEIDPREFDTPEYRKNPFPLYKRLRDHRPLFRDGFHGRWVLSRYEDIVNVFQDNEHYDRALYKPDGPYKFGQRSVFGPNILEYGNSQRHRWMRNIVADQFVGNRLQAFLPYIEMIARELLGSIVEKAADDIAQGLRRYRRGRARRAVQQPVPRARHLQHARAGPLRRGHLRALVPAPHRGHGLGPVLRRRHPRPRRDLGLPRPHHQGAHEEPRRGSRFPHRHRRTQGPAHERRRGQGLRRPPPRRRRRYHRQGHRQHVVPHALHPPRPVPGGPARPLPLDQRVHRDDALRPGRARPGAAHHRRDRDVRRGHPRACLRLPLPRRRQPR